MQQNLPQHDAELRRQQIEEARRMGDVEELTPVSRPTLSVRPGFSRPANNEMVGGTGGSIRTRTPLRPVNSKDKLKGHEAFIKALEFNGATVVIEKISDGSKLTGVAKHSDKFTITLRTTDATGVTVDRVIFKHDISEFYTISPRPEKIEVAEESLAA